MTRIIQRLVSVTGVTVFVIAVATFTPTLFAQKKTRAERREEANSRAVQGIVTGVDDKPAQGAVVMLKDLKSLQVRSFITQVDGTYHFSGLKADVDYELNAKSGEAASPTRKLSIFDTRKEAIVNFKLEKK
ncbi:MAG: carboxypeptidase-like regulatory domain-containing protein [Bryobacteraceae bacterium]